MEDIVMPENSDYSLWRSSAESPNRPSELKDSISVRPGVNLHDDSGLFDRLFNSWSRFFPCPLLQWPNLERTRQLNLDVIMQADPDDEGNLEFGATTWADEEVSWIVFHLGTYFRLIEFVHGMFINPRIRAGLNLDAFPPDFVEVTKEWMIACGCDWILLHEFGHVSRGHGLETGEAFNDSSKLLAKYNQIIGQEAKNQERINREIAADFYAARSFAECIRSRYFISLDLENIWQELNQLPEHYVWIPSLLGACSTLAWLCYYDRENELNYPTLEQRIAILALGIGRAAHDDDYASTLSNEQKEQFAFLTMKLVGVLGEGFGAIGDQKAERVAIRFKALGRWDDWIASIQEASSLIDSVGRTGLIKPVFRRPPMPWAGVDTFF